MDIRVQQTIERMQRQLEKRLTVSDFAREADLSVAQLTRLFRQATGRTPGAFLRDLRMTRARLLIEQTSLLVSEVMAQVGVADRSHFARDFRASYGFSPRMLRMHLRVGARIRLRG